MLKFVKFVLYIYLNHYQKLGTYTANYMKPHWKGVQPILLFISGIFHLK